jgi:hypothetical protein
MYQNCEQKFSFRKDTRLSHGLFYEEVKSGQGRSFQKSILTTKHSEIGASSQETCSLDDIGRDKEQLTEP